MKTLFPAALCCAALLIAGCESGMPDDVRAALGPREAPRTRVFQADQRATYEAAKTAVDQMGFRFVRGGPAEGRLEAMSAISVGDEPSSSRQFSMKVQLTPAAESGTEVEISLTEMIEEDPTGQQGIATQAPIQGLATQTPLRDTPLYEVFFRNVQTALQVAAKN